MLKVLRKGRHLWLLSEEYLTEEKWGVSVVWVSGGSLDIPGVVALRMVENGWIRAVL